MNNATAETTHEAEIRRLFENYTAALHAKDVQQLLSHYASDVVSFDLAPPLQYAGIAALRQSFEGWFSTFRSPIGHETRELKIEASADLAVCRSINRITGSRTDGTETDVWVRATVCCRKTDGQWRIVHEHQSVPFYMDGSYRAAVDLKP